MICPRCGKDIADAQDTCPSCGSVLNDAEEQKSQSFDKRNVRRCAGLSKPSFGARPSRKKRDIKPSGPASADDEKDKPIQADTNTNLPSDSTQETEVPFTAQETDKPDITPEATPTDDLTGDQEPVAPFMDDESDEADETGTQKRKRGKKDKKARKRRLSKGMRIFIWSVVCLVVIGGGVGMHFYVRAQYSTWPRMFKVVFGIGQTQVYPVTVEAVTGSDGFPAHRFVIRGDNPDVVVVHTLNDQHLTFIDGAATVTIPDSFFIPETVTENAETITVDVAFSILDNRGELTSVPCDPVIIDIPQSVVSNLMPAENEVLTYQQTVDVSMNVLDNSTVTINGEDVTADITDGLVSKSLPVEMGENTIEIVVNTPYYRAFTHTVVVTRTLPPVSVSVEKEPANRTEDRSITITGTYEKGASLKLTGDGRLSYSRSKGTFTITLSMSNLGLYEGTLTATLSGKSDGVYNYRVERIPDATDYQKAATTPDLAELFADFSDYKGDKLKLSGTVSAVEENSLTLALGEGQDLTFTYYGDTIISIGDMVTVYGEIQSITDDVPSCYAWFVVL